MFPAHPLSSYPCRPFVSLFYPKSSKLSIFAHFFLGQFSFAHSTCFFNFCILPVCRVVALHLSEFILHSLMKWLEGERVRARRLRGERIGDDPFRGCKGGERRHRIVGSRFCGDCAAASTIRRFFLSIRNPTDPLSSRRALRRRA